MTSPERIVRNPAVFDAGDIVLDCGITLTAAKIAYESRGVLNPSGTNAILFPTRFGGRHEDNDYLIGRGRPLDPGKYFVLVPNLVGNGVSSSPSNTPPPLDGGNFPRTTIYDNVRLQHRLANHLGIERFELVLGWSMGGQQAYHWAVLHPEMATRIAVICGAARTAPHTYVFLEGVKAALTTDAAYQGGFYAAQPERGLRAIGRVWAGWALSQEFYRRQRFREMGYASIDDFLTRYWETLYLARDANNLVSMIRTWQAADVSANDQYQGDYVRAMRSIRAPTLVMPGKTDLYFPPEDSCEEVRFLARGELRTIPSIWGHYAGGGRDGSDTAFIDEGLRDLLRQST